jgi:heme/copper-type cytochrome/quinol oxidase subunit 2
MALTLAIAYGAVAIVAAFVVFLVSARLGDERRPTPERFGLSVAAGIVWPVILLGVAELSSFAMYAKVHEHDDDPERVLVVV